MSALLTRQGLSERQAAFVSAYLKSGLSGKAALEAGYSNVNDGSRLLRVSHVVAAIHREIQRELVVDAAPLAFRTIHDMMKAKDTPHGIKADLAVKVMKLAGHVQPTNRDQAAEKQPAEMTREEMVAYIERSQAEIDRFEAELAARAKDVSGQGSEPITPLAEPKPLPFLD